MYKVTALSLKGLGVVQIKQSTDEFVHVETPKLVKVKQDRDSLTIEGDGSSSGGVTISSGNIHISGGSIISGSKTIIRGNSNLVIGNTGGKSIKIIGDDVWVDGKHVSGKSDTESVNNEEDDKPTIISIPDGLSFVIEDCEYVAMQNDFTFSTITIQAQSQSAVRAKKIITASANISTSGQSVLLIDYLQTTVFVGTSSEQSTLKISNGKITQVVIASSGQSTLKIEGLLDSVSANSSGQSSCRFASPSKMRAIANASGQSTCRAI